MYVEITCNYLIFSRYLYNLINRMGQVKEYIRWFYISLDLIFDYNINLFNKNSLLIALSYFHQ
jgi:hypothetical protein